MFAKQCCPRERRQHPDLTLLREAHDARTSRTALLRRFFLLGGLLLASLSLLRRHEWLLLL